MITKKITPNKNSSSNRKHIIKSDYDAWINNTYLINSGMARLLIKEAKNKVYSTEKEPLNYLFKVKVQHISIHVAYKIIIVIVDGFRLSDKQIKKLIKNEGMNEVDFITNFSKPVINGAIVQLTDLIY